MPFLLPNEQSQSIESKDRQPHNLRLFVFANTELKHMATVRDFYKNIYTVTKLALSRSGLVPQNWTAAITGAGLLGGWFLSCCSYQQWHSMEETSKYSHKSKKSPTGSHTFLRCQMTHGGTDFALSIWRQYPAIIATEHIKTTTHEQSNLLAKYLQ